MNHRFSILLFASYLLLAGADPTLAQDELLPLPQWQVLEFEEKAFWATANSRLEVVASSEDPTHWQLKVLNTVVGNTEQITLEFAPETGQLYSQDRLSKGKDQRFKSFDYGPKSMLRERRVPPGDTSPAEPQDWPVKSKKQVPYPAAVAADGVTQPYLIPLLAARLAAEGLGATQEILVHTDQNFYRVSLTSGKGDTIEVDYQTSDRQYISGARATTAVTLRVQPEGTLPDKTDFSLLGLDGEIVLLFDKSSGLLLQLRGIAPRLGATHINLKSVSMRTPQS